MTLEQVVLTMINDKMLDNGQISEKLHSSIQKDIITLSTFNTVVAKNGEQMDSSDEYCQRNHPQCRIRCHQGPAVLSGQPGRAERHRYFRRRPGPARSRRFAS